MKVQPILIPLSKLHFDLNNPRYGRRSKSVKTEHDALNMIVDDFGVDDLLQSIVTNGFFEGEPLIVKEENGGYKVLEGNRRLAAVLIITQDQRAAEQKRRCSIFGTKASEAGTQIDAAGIPALVVKDEKFGKEVLSYLGTKHIVGPTEWDSYAKARWIAEMRASTDLELKQIKEMIGDVSGFVDRMLEGYYVVEQLREAGLFEPEQSYVGGRGSNPEFPFSWIYTALNLSNVRKFIGIQDREVENDPVPSEKLNEASDLMLMMFGHKASGREPVIEESRDIARLGRALADPMKSALLREGESLEEVEEKTKPVTDRLNVQLSNALEALGIANGLISQGGLTQAEASGLLVTAESVLNAARSLRVSLRNVGDQYED